MSGRRSDVAPAASGRRPRARRGLAPLVLLSLVAASLVVVALEGPDWPVPDMPRRLTLGFGWLAAVTGLGALGYTVRKRLAPPGLGRLDRWLLAHVWLSVIFALALVLHISLGSADGLATVRGGLASVAAAVAALLVLTGIAGSLLYAWLPTRLAREQAALLRRVEEISAVIERLRDGKSAAFRRATDAKQPLASEARRAAAYWRSLAADEQDVPDEETADLAHAADLLAWRAELWDEAASQLGYAPLMRGFLVSHVVLSATLVLLVGVHVLDVYRPLPRPTPAVRDYPSANACASCHPAVVAAWRTSPHAAAASSPVTRAMNEGVAATLTAAHVTSAGRPAGASEGETVQANATCMGCHAPVGAMTGRFAGPASTQRGPLPGAAGEGITCVVCHAQRHELPDSAATRGVVELGTTDPPFAFRWSGTVVGPFGRGTPDDPRPVRNAFHRSAPTPELTQSEMCGACHNVTIDRGPVSDEHGAPGPVVRLQETYDEWAASPAAARGTTCQGCHMPRREPAAAAAAPWGVTFERPLAPRAQSDHHFVGVDSEFWSDRPEAPAAAQRRERLLRSAAQLELTAPPSVAPGDAIEIEVAVRNVGAGHDLPSGFVFEREVWLEVDVRDGAGEALLLSGQRDDDGWLHDELNPRVRSDPSRYDAFLLNLRGRMVRVRADRAAWRQPDRTVAVPPAVVDRRRNANGTPVLDSAGFDAAPIVDALDDARDASAAEAGADAGGAPSPRASAPVVGADASSSSTPSGPASSPSARSPIEEVFLQSEADAVIKNGIAAGEIRRARYPVDVPRTARGPISVRVRLLLRPLPPYVLDTVLGLPELVARVPTYELGRAEATVPLVAR